MLLGNGRTVYHGPAHEGIHFFRTIGTEFNSVKSTGSWFNQLSFKYYIMF